MASSSSRKSNSSASKQKPTFRRSTGAPSSRSASGARPKAASPAPVAHSAHAPARTYVAPTKRAAVNHVSSARASRSKQMSAKPLGTRSGSPSVRPAARASASAAPTKRKAATSIKRVPSRPAAPARAAAASPAARPARRAPQAKLAAPVSGPKVKAPVKQKAKPVKSAPSLGQVRAKGPTSHKFDLKSSQPVKLLAGAGAALSTARKGSAPAGSAQPSAAASARVMLTLPSAPRIIVAVVLAIVLVFGLGAAVLVNSSFFSVTDVVVNGSEHVPQQTVEQLVSVPEGSTLFNVSDEDIAAALLQNPWVSSVDIERQFPHTIVITPVERKVQAIVYLSADDIAWAVSEDSHWIAPVSLASASTGQTSTDTAEGDGGEGSSTDAEATGTTGTATSTSSSSQRSIDAAVALARQAGAVLLSDVGTDVSPSSGQEVTDDTVLAGLEYAKGFSADFLSQIKEISIPSVEAISCDLESGVEVSLGKPEDIQQKEQVVRRLLEQEQGVTYINVRVADAYTFRSATV